MNRNWPAWPGRGWTSPAAWGVLEPSENRQQRRAGANSQELGVELRPERRGEVEEIPSLGIEQVFAASEQRGERSVPAVSRQVRHEEWIAVGFGDDRLGFRLAHVDEHGNIVGVQTSKRNSGHRWRPFKIGEQHVEAIVDVRRGVAGGGHEEQRTPSGQAHEVAQQLPWSRPSTSARPRGRRAAAPPTLPASSQARIAAGRSPCRSVEGRGVTSRDVAIADSPGELGCQASQHRLPPATRRRATSSRARSAASAEIASANGPYGWSASIAASEEHPTTVMVDLDGELCYEPALANTGLAGDEREHGVTRWCELPLVSKRRTLRRAADEGRGVGKQLQRWWQRRDSDLTTRRVAAKIGSRSLAVNAKACSRWSRPRKLEQPEVDEFTPCR